MSSLRALCGLALVVLGCGGRYGGTPLSRPTGPKAGIEAAALPYEVVDARTSHQVEPAAFWSRVAQARAVCVGEDHNNPHHHWFQLEVVKRIAKAMAPGDKLALGMEMVQRPFQGVLDDYAAKRIDAAALRSRTGWEERWGFDFDFYGPTIDAAVAAGAHLIALNAPKELTKKVSHKGLEALTPEERAQVPELRLDDAAHRAWFDALMEEMGGTSAHATNKGGDQPPDPDSKPMPEMPSADRIYTVQVIWDESMAEGAAKWLAATPNGHIVILAGNGHCHDSAIVNRIKRRGIADVISLRAVVDDGQGGVAEVLAKPINDFVVVLRFPAGTKPKAEPHEGM
jgi:uncharacterized iron-regulated protein